MKNTVKALIVTAIAGIALTACTTESKNVAATGTETTTTASTTSSASVQPPTSTVHVTETQTQQVKAVDNAPPVLDHFGLGPVKLGMTLDQLKAGGYITTMKGDAGPACTRYNLTFGGSAGIDPKRGVVSIWMPERTRTVEGQVLGMAIAGLELKHTGVERGPNGTKVPLADNPDAYYFVTENVQSHITSITLSVPGQACYN